MEKSYIARTSGIGTREKWGYAMGDVGSLLVFGLVQSVLQKYYTDVLAIPVALVMVLFIIARVWDAVNDPLWGRIVDAQPVGADGRYRRWLKRLTVPLSLSAILMFVRIPGLSPTGSFIYACVTYILFGMLYTGLNIPYGSMASVITTDDAERSSLSIYRSIGSTLGALPAMVLISACYVKVDGVSVMSYPKIFVGVVLISALSVAACLLCYRWTVERVPSPPKVKQERGATLRVLKALLKSRPFVTLSLACMLFLAAQMFSQSYYSYLFANYFNAPGLTMLPTVCQYLPVLAIMGFIGKWNRRFGRKELCALGMLAAGVLNLVLYFLHTTNPWVFLLVCFLSGIGNAFIFLQVWALATEAIDYNAVQFGIRDDATSYSVFTFMRKLGQTVAAILVNAALLKIGYSADNLTESALSGMYSSSVLIPAVLYLLIFLLLWFGYPLGKRELARLQAQKEEKLKSYFED